eukprot:TRINITY_DN1786_c0_g1_i1.p1 TRINITY_DN1786_c0_g1~~TRINITY_DN1786_c0_g1_i1.p1  ORF type:complete len:113 (-),score=1.93 TRINITY_DN1786_c0_g1_i1:720-1058(-)
MRLLLLFSIIGLYLLLIFSASTLSYSYENTNPKKVGVMSVVCPNNANCPTGDTCCPLSGNDGIILFRFIYFLILSFIFIHFFLTYVSCGSIRLKGITITRRILCVQLDVDTC